MTDTDTDTTTQVDLTALPPTPAVKSASRQLPLRALLGA